MSDVEQEIKPLVSIIVPVYNVEDYVAECIESLLNQSYQNIEIILMDDGSKDKSADSCLKYAQKDSRIKFYQQENKGVASARKNASKYITGKYVTFVDSDDYIEAFFIEKMIQKMKGFDLVTSGYYYGCGDEVKCFDGLHKGSYKTEKELEYVYSNFIMMENTKNMGIHRSLWAKMFDAVLAKEVFQTIDENIFWGEDGDFLYRYVLKCKSIQITEICGYHYRMRDNSAVHMVNKTFLKNIDAIYNGLEPVFSSHEYNKVLLFQLQAWIMQMIHQAPCYLGFIDEVQETPYVFPDLKNIMGKSIIIYGAGNVGKSYKTFFERYNICKISLWVDQRAEMYSENYEVSNIDKLFVGEYDYLIIAVKKKELAADIKARLLAMNIQENKILWEMPLEN